MLARGLASFPDRGGLAVAIKIEDQRPGGGPDRGEGGSVPSPFEARLRELLARVATGEVAPEDAAAALRDLPFTDLGFAKVDHHRELRQGHCEIVLAAGKTPDQVAAI